MSIELSLTESVADFPLGLWQELEGPADYPFLRREFLLAFEQARTLGVDRGWIPRHVTLRRASGSRRETLAVAPAYVKLHSMGEFVFDHAWAELSEMRLGVRYYPKLILAVPFTPATGPRILFRKGLSPAERDEVYDVLTGALPDLAERLGLSSVHVLFPDQAQADQLHQRDWALRLGVQFQFKNPGHQSFDDYIHAFRSKRRNQIRREVRSLTEQGVQISVRTGAQLRPDDARLAYRIYLTTVDKYVWGQRYLTADFFERVFAEMPDAIHFVTASVGGSSGEEAVVAGAVNLLGAHGLYGRYWGCFKDVPYLHFNVCLYQGVRETIERGLLRFEPGAGGEHKEGRGFSATQTSSLHYLGDARLDRIVRDFLLREAEAVRCRTGLAGQDEGSDG